MISDEERREVARKLREDAANDKLREQVFVEEIIAGCIGETMHDEWGNVREVEILTKLADLIDVPTTVLDLTETTRTVHGEEVRGWECRECGQSCEEMYGGYEYCPHCGRKVER